MALKVKEGETILFIGDSITDCGRCGGAAPLGEGYVKIFSELAGIREPEKAARVTIINKGTSGHKVTDLQARWTDDALRHKPNWLSVKIGINDLHNALNDPVNGVTPAVFEKAYDDILSRTVKALPRCRILLIDPFFLSLETSPLSFRRRVLDAMPGYLGVVARMARKYKARHIRTHEKFLRILQTHEPDELCPEPVHPYRGGHLAIAEWVYEALSK